MIFFRYIAGDADGNQNHIQTETGNWALNYNAANRPTDFSCMDEEGNFNTVKCDYDSMGRRTFKKDICSNGTVISHHPPPQTLSAIARRACYACLPSQSGNAAEAGCDLTRTNHPALWLMTWAPTQTIATRPLAIQKDGTWYTYGLDLTKNVCEIFGPAGNIRTTYTYSPYGSVTSTGNVTQPIQWSSEYYDEEMGLVYYNWRYYNTQNGRWIKMDPIGIRAGKNMYSFLSNDFMAATDLLGLNTVVVSGGINTNSDKDGYTVRGTELKSRTPFTIGVNTKRYGKAVSQSFTQPASSCMGSTSSCVYVATARAGFCSGKGTEHEQAHSRQVKKIRRNASYQRNGRSGIKARV